jgi:hypothetical protein
MIIAIYNDDYDNNFVATGETIEAVMRQLEENSGEDSISMGSLVVFEGTPVKVTKTVTYTVQKD